MMFIFVLLPTLVTTDSFFVDSGSQATEENGSKVSPFKTIARCVDKLENPGDECLLKTGFYSEDEICISGLSGTESNPIKIKAAPNSKPVIDGTKILNPTWSAPDTDNVISGILQENVWQLFVCDEADDVDSCEMMTNARWPNARWSDKTVFQSANWANIEKENYQSARQQITNRDNSLADSNINMTDAMAVMNIGAWNTFVGKVESHNGNSFTYAENFGDFTVKGEKSRYFLEDKIDLLDDFEEWHFDKITKKLSFILPEGKDISTVTIRGKVKTYSMTIRKSSNLVIEGLDFFGTTLRAVSTSKPAVHNLLLDSNRFLYPSYSRRMLSETGLIAKTELDGRLWGNTAIWGTMHVRNNLFYGSDGVALFFDGINNVIELNRFEYNDWTSANMLRHEGGKGTLVVGKSYNDVIEKNTFFKNGNGVAIRPGYNATVRMNNIEGQCFGYQQNDGAAIQVEEGKQDGVIIERNWVHDSPKHGMRFDAVMPLEDGSDVTVGLHGTMRENVVWNCAGYDIKGNEHTIEGNLGFDKYTTRPILPEDCTLCLFHQNYNDDQRFNQESDCNLNIADRANGGKQFQTGTWKKKKDANGNPLTFDLPGNTNQGNVVGKTLIRETLMDIDCGDFRPVVGGEADLLGAGPYTSDTSGTSSVSYYWIPGRPDERKASTPVPFDGSTARADRRSTLMWLGCTLCVEYKVYFGKSTLGFEDGLAARKHVISSPNNMFRINWPLAVGKTYYWKIDGLDGSGRVIESGDVWSFDTI